MYIYIYDIYKYISSPSANYSIALSKLIGVIGGHIWATCHIRIMWHKKCGCVCVCVCVCVCLRSRGWLVSNMWMRHVTQKKIECVMSRIVDIGSVDDAGAHTYIHAYIQSCKHAYILTYKHTAIRTHIADIGSVDGAGAHTNTHTYKPTNIQTNKHAYMYTYVHTHVNIPTYKRTCTYSTYEHS